MAYLALYRAFRPTTLSDVVRQEHIVKILKNQIETGKVGHAYLFCGPRGTGKTSIAKIFASAINCENPVDGSPCGKCPTCRALADPSNLDIAEIDAASNNGVDEMRDLREKVQYPPVAGKYKVYIVDEVHMLSPGAFNALLKTLEEPPSHAVFILATTEVQKIPATILSRCMRFDFRLIPQSDLEERLKYVFRSIGKEYEEEAVSAIARAGAGSVRDTLSLADTCVSYSTGKLTYADVTAVLGGADFLQTASLLESCFTGNAGKALEQGEKILAEGRSVGVLIKDVLNFLNACAVAKNCRDAKKILALDDSSFEKVKAVSEQADGHAILRTTEIFSKAESDCKYSVSPRIVFETALLKAGLPSEDYDLESILTRLALIEKKLAGAPVTVIANTEEQTEKPVIPQFKAKEDDGEQPFDTDYSFIPPEDDGDGSFISEPPVRQRVESQPSVGTGKPQSVSQPVVPPTATIKQATAGDARGTFGSFLRSLRKIGRNGVLFAICSDLDGEYDGDTFVLPTTSETIYTTLNKEQHYAIIKESLEAVGVTKFEIRLKGKKADTFSQDTETVKSTFPGIKTEIK